MPAIDLHLENRISKVMDLFWRLPLISLFCQPEAVHLGDLMWFYHNWV